MSVIQQDLAPERGRDAGDQRLRTDETGRPREAIGEGHGGIVQPLLLLRGQDGLEAAADDPVDDDAHQQEHAEDRDPQQETEAPGQRPSPWCRRRLDGHATSGDATRR